MISDNSIIYTLFYTDIEEDHTLYNIAVSYVAAYIFYLIQVYFPERRKTAVAIVQTKLNMLNCLCQCVVFSKGWEEYTTRNSASGTITDVNIKNLYFQDGFGNTVQISKEGLKDTVQRISEEYNKIKENIDFKNTDIELQKLFLDMNFPEQADKWYQIMLGAEILCNKENSTIQEYYSEKEFIEFELRVIKLAIIYQIDGRYISLEEATDTKKMEYQQRMSEINQVIEENYEYFKNHQKTNNK